MRKRMLLGLMAVLALALVVSASPPAEAASDSYMVTATDLVAASTTPATGGVSLESVVIMNDPDIGGYASIPIYATNERRDGDARLIPKEKVAAPAPRASGANLRTLNSADCNANALRVYRT